MLKGQEIRRFRDSEDLSLSDMATLLSQELSKTRPTIVNPSTISRWENETSKPRASYLKALKKIMFYKEDDGMYTRTIDSTLGIDTSRNISGEWLTKWSFKENGILNENSDKLVIEHNGDIVKGESKGNNEFNYKIIAHLMKDGVISGKWYSILSESIHHGVFMIKLRPNGRRGEGDWLGTYVKNGIEFMHGKWAWKKVQR